MEFRDAQPFMENHHLGVVTSQQPDGAAHVSIVVCGTYQDQAAFVAVRGNSVKVHNLRRDPHCTVTTITPDWRNWVSVEGEARLFDYRNTDTEEMRILLREVFRACGDKDHPDWEEYDQAMREQDAVVVLVPPKRVYGILRS